jgi:catechol 2,3-dioxygenase-like lactoylglutathione lyase family enzyme
MSFERNIRRVFLTVSGLVIVLACLAIFASSCKKEELDPLVYPEKSVVFKELVLRTASVQAATDFWHGQLGFQLIDSTFNSVTFQVGSSRLKFLNQVTINPPIYHFAIEIPSNQVENALDWLKNEGGKYPDGPQQPVNILVDEESDAEIIYRPLYRSRSVFFKDPNGQIVELIGREENANTAEGNFSASMMSKICDFSLITKDVRKCETLLNEEFGFRSFQGTTSSYKPVGGAAGTLTMIIPGRPFIPTESIESFPYGAVVVIEYPEDKEFTLPGSEVIIRTEP